MTRIETFTINIFFAKLIIYINYKSDRVLFNIYYKSVTTELLKYRSGTGHMNWRYFELILDNLDVEYNC